MTLDGTIREGRDAYLSVDKVDAALRQEKDVDTPSLQEKDIERVRLTMVRSANRGNSPQVAETDSSRILRYHISLETARDLRDQLAEILGVADHS